MPKFIPIPYIKIGGQDVAKALGDAILEIVVDTSLYLPSMFTIKLMDPALKWVDDALLDIGKEVEIRMKGDENEGPTQAAILIKEGALCRILHSDDLRADASGGDFKFRIALAPWEERRRPWPYGRGQAPGDLRLCPPHLFPVVHPHVGYDKELRLEEAAGLDVQALRLDAHHFGHHGPDAEGGRFLDESFLFQDCGQPSPDNFLLPAVGKDKDGL